MGNMFLSHKNRASVVGALTAASGAPASNLLLPEMDAVWNGTARTDYLEFMTGVPVLRRRVASLAVSASLRSVHVHGTGRWVLLAVSTQLEVRAYNAITGEVGAAAVSTKAQPAGQLWTAAKFAPIAGASGLFILASCEASGGNATVRLYHFNPTTGAIGNAITIPTFSSSAPWTGQRSIAWAPNGLAFAVAHDRASVPLWRLDPATATVTHAGDATPGTGSADCLSVEFGTAWPASGTAYLFVGYNEGVRLKAFPLTLNSSGAPTAIGAAISPGVGVGANVTALAMSPDGSRLAVMTATPAAAVYPWTGSAFGAAWAAPSPQVTNERPAIAWGIAGNYLLFAGGGINAPDVYQVSASAFVAKVTEIWDTPNAFQNAVAIAPAGNFLLCITSGGAVESCEFTESPSPARVIDLIAIIRLLCTRGLTIRVRGNALRDMSGGGGYDSGSPAAAFDLATIDQEIFDLVSEECGPNVYFLLPSPQTFMFWRVDLVDTALPAVGFTASLLIAAPRAGTTTARNMKRGAAPGVNDDATERDRTAGNTDVFTHRAGRRRIDLSIDLLAQTYVRADWVPITLRAQRARVLFLPNTGDAFLNFCFGFYGAPLGSPPPFPFQSGGRHDVALRLEEIR